MVALNVLLYVSSEPSLWAPAILASYVAYQPVMYRCRKGAGFYGLPSITRVWQLDIGNMPEAASSSGQGYPMQLIKLDDACSAAGVFKGCAHRWAGC